jgi:hypothetical protein
MYAYYDFPERDRRRVVAGRRERSSRWRWHCPHRNLHLCHCRMQSTEMADKGLLSTIPGMPRSTCAAAQRMPRRQDDGPGATGMCKGTFSFSRTNSTVFHGYLMDTAGNGRLASWLLVGWLVAGWLLAGCWL